VLINAPANVTTTLPGVVHYEDLIGDQSPDFAWPDLDENTACGLCYTSGTTGEPKGRVVFAPLHLPARHGDHDAQRGQREFGRHGPAHRARSST
jgi:acyl-coenzyme A synthetase/AMP-(fatty) acid ligase